ncbi:MAG: tetratricopeptide repeat protein [Bryobacteraceae bacterium]
MHRSLALLVAGGVALWSQQTDTSGAVISALHAGNYAQAKRISEEELKQFPGDARLWTLNGLALVHLGQGAQALASYQQALRISPSYLPALEGAAEIEYKDGSQAAAPLLEQIAKAHPEDKTSHGMLAVLAFKRGDCQTAVEEFGRSEPLIDSQASPLQEYGSCLVKINKPQEAISVFERISELQSGDERARYNLAVVQSLAGRYRDVIQTLSSFPNVGANAGFSDPDVLDLLSEAYEATSDTPRAVESLRRAIIANPDDARYYVHFADICLTHASYKVGVDMLNAGLKWLPGSAPLYVARGILLIQLGQYEESESDFSKAEQLDPSAEAGSAARSMAALQQNNLAEAEATIRDRLKRQPDDSFLYYLLAETLARKGATVGTANFREALDAASKAVRLRPDFASARDVLGRLYLQEGNINEAIEQSRLAVRADPTDQTALYHLILALRKTDKKDELPKLGAQLTALREQARRRENSERKYALVEQSTTAGSIPK